MGLIFLPRGELAKAAKIDQEYSAHQVIGEGVKKIFAVSNRSVLFRRGRFLDANRNVKNRMAEFFWFAGFAPCVIQKSERYLR